MDPIANMLTSIRNSSLARKATVCVPYSTLKHRISEVLRQEGYVGPVTVTEEGPQKVLEIMLLSPRVFRRFKALSA
jgi:small subunit ribosomal protein S8